MRKVLPFVALVLALGAGAAPAQSFPPAPPLGEPKPFRVPQTETYALPNGLKVTLIPYGLAPKATVRLTVDAGEVDAGRDTALGDLAAQMLKEGAGQRTGTQIAEAAAAMGGDLSVKEDDHQTTLSLDVLSEHVPGAVALVADVALHPDFPADAFARVKSSQLRQLSVELSRPDPVADYALDRATFGPDHPYGAIPSAAQIGGYTLAQAKAFHDANFGAGRAHLYIAGRFEAAAAKAAIAKAFGGWAPGAPRMAPAASFKPGPQTILVDRPGAPQSTLRLAFPVPLRSDPDALKIEAMDALLGGAFSSRITTNIREAKGYTYSPYSYIDARHRNAAWIEGADVTTTVTGASLHEIYGEVRRLQQTPPGAEETAGIRTYLAGLFTLSNSYTDGLLGSIVERDRLELPADWLDNYVPGILVVTPADIQAQAIKRLPLETATLVVVGDLKTVVPQLKAQPELQRATMQTVTIP